ncbi:MAG: hypothetical protein ABIO46_08070 [Chitinophagales bacterium]
MKNISLRLSILLFASCSTPTYLVSNQLKVTSVTTMNGTLLVEVCGENNKGELSYSWYIPDGPKNVGDTLQIR